MQHREGRFKGLKDFSLYYQGWLPSGPPRAVLVVVHGMAEHCGRYSNLADYFVPRGYAVFGLDHRGHGQSEGLRCYVDRFSDYLDDLKTFLDLLRREYRYDKVFLIGHSMGGTIAAAYATRRQDGLAGLILSAPALKAGPSVSRLDMALARVLSVLAPKMGVAALDATAISRDKAVVEAYLADPLVYQGKIRARLGAELLSMIEDQLPARMADIKLPVLIMHATADRLSNPEGSRILYERVGSADKTLKYYEGLYHEIFNEPEWGQILADVETWLAARLDKTTGATGLRVCEPAAGNQRSADSSGLKPKAEL